MIFNLHPKKSVNNFLHIFFLAAFACLITFGYLSVTGVFANQADNSPIGTVSGPVTMVKVYVGNCAIYDGENGCDGTAYNEDMIINASSCNNRGGVLSTMTDGTSGRLEFYVVCSQLNLTDPISYSVDATTNYNEYSQNIPVMGTYAGQSTFDISMPVYGCMDPNALNYNPNATVDDSSCGYALAGCTDPAALNYNPSANTDDGSCEFAPMDIDAPSLISFISNLASGTYGPGTVIEIIAQFDEDIASGNMSITLSNGVSLSLQLSSATTLSANYTVGDIGSGEDTTDLTVASIDLANVCDGVSNCATNYSIPSGSNLGDSENITIDVTDEPVVQEPDPEPAPAPQAPGRITGYSSGGSGGFVTGPTGSSGVGAGTASNGTDSAAGTGGVNGNSDGGAGTSQTGLVETAGASKGYSFTRTLTLGSRGLDVLRLQKILNLLGYKVRATGPGSEGHETAYFGTSTKEALARLQKDARILTTTGYFGPITQSYINALLFRSEGR